MKKSLLILFVLFNLVAKAQETFLINGIVSDEQGKAIPGATVFITNSKYITATDSNGKFKFYSVQPGTYEVTVKMIGYKLLAYNFLVKNKPVQLFIKLTEDNRILNTVTIKSNLVDKSREGYMALFMQYFIGQSANAGQCKILDPQVINFHYDKTNDILTACADDFITVENKGLGYKINFLLTEFSFDNKKQLFSYSGHPYFEELKGSELQQEKWDKNREIAYAGSIHHFFRSVFNHTAETQGFYVFTLTKLAGKKSPSARPVNPDSLFESVDRNFKLLKPKYNEHTSTDTSALYIAYRGEKAPFDFTASPLFIKPPVKLSSSTDQLSKIQPVADNIMIDKSGSLIPPKSFFMSGYWAWEKVAELTPVDYFAETRTRANTSASADSVMAAGDKSRTKMIIFKGENLTSKP